MMKRSMMVMLVTFAFAVALPWTTAARPLMADEAGTFEVPKRILDAVSKADPGLVDVIRGRADCRVIARRAFMTGARMGFKAGFRAGVFHQIAAFRKASGAGKGAGEPEGKRVRDLAARKRLAMARRRKLVKRSQRRLAQRAGPKCAPIARRAFKVGIKISFKRGVMEALDMNDMDHAKPNAVSKKALDEIMGAFKEQVKEMKS